AYRMARFVLAHRNPGGPDVQRAETLEVDPSDPVARHVAAGAHGGLLTLERTLNDKGVLRTVITVDETRETISFFGSSAAGEGWGSVVRALTLLGGDAIRLRQRTAASLATLPRVDPRDLHALGDALGGSDRVAPATFVDSVDRWISERLRADDANANANLAR